MIGLRNFIYVYGGISGSGQGQQAHFPELAQITVEQYTIASDVWSTIAISTAPKLAAFSWCQMGDTAQLAIVGGTNGDIQSDEMYIMDLQAGTVQSSSFEFNTSMGLMSYNQRTNTLYHIGGMNSDGVDYKVTLDDAERRWTEIDHNHSLVLNANCLELCNAPSVYFY